MPNDLGLNSACVTIAYMRRLAVSAALVLLASAPTRAADDPLARARLLQPGTVRGGDQRRRAGAPDAVASRRRRSRRRARIPRAFPRQRRGRRSRQRARSPAPDRSAAFRVHRARRIRGRSGRGALFRGCLRRRRRRARSDRAESRSSGGRCAGARTRLVGERARSRRQAAPRNRSPGCLSAHPRTDGRRAVHASRQRDRRVLARRRCPRARRRAGGMGCSARRLGARAADVGSRGDPARRHRSVSCCAIVPDRAKVTAQPPETLRQQWEVFKERWTRE